ncbi:hypothetical protein T484DRAFT_1920407, partial [Baffinella frigidus]
MPRFRSRTSSAASAEPEGNPRHESGSVNETASADVSLEDGDTSAMPTIGEAGAIEMLGKGISMYKYTHSQQDVGDLKKRLKQKRHVRVFRITEDKAGLALTWRQPTWIAMRKDRAVPLSDVVAVRFGEAEITEAHPGWLLSDRAKCWTVDYSDGTGQVVSLNLCCLTEADLTTWQQGLNALLEQSRALSAAASAASGTLDTGRGGGGGGGEDGAYGQAEAGVRKLQALVRGGQTRTLLRSRRIWSSRCCKGGGSPRPPGPTPRRRASCVRSHSGVTRESRSRFLSLRRLAGSGSFSCRVPSRASSHLQGPPSTKTHRVLLGSASSAVADLVASWQPSGTALALTDAADGRGDLVRGAGGVGEASVALRVRADAGGGEGGFSDENLGSFKGDAGEQMRWDAMEDEYQGKKPLHLQLKRSMDHNKEVQKWAFRDGDKLRRLEERLVSVSAKLDEVAAEEKRLTDLLDTFQTVTTELDSRSDALDSLVASIEDLTQDRWALEEKFRACEAFVETGVAPLLAELEKKVASNKRACAVCRAASSSLDEDLSLLPPPRKSKPVAVYASLLLPVLVLAALLGYVLLSREAPSAPRNPKHSSNLRNLPSPEADKMTLPSSAEKTARPSSSPLPSSS